MSQKVIIYYTLEMADHDTFCSASDSECTYSLEHKSLETDIQNLIIDRDDDGRIKNQNDFICHVPDPEMALAPGMCCDISEECVANGLDKHEYRITIDDVVIAYGKNPYSRVNKDNPYS